VKIISPLYEENGIFINECAEDISYPVGGSQVFASIEDTSFWFNHRNNCLNEVAKKNLPKGDDIIEIGGGNGFVSSMLQKSGYNVTMIEPDKEGVLKAQSRGVKNLICSSFDTLEIENDSVANVGLFDVLEHIQYDFDFLSSIFSKLKPGGNIILTVPAYSFLWSLEDKFDGHFRRYSLGEVKGLMEKTGFNIIYSSYFFSILPPLIFSFRTIPHRLSMLLNSNYQYLRKSETLLKEHGQDSFSLTKLFTPFWTIERALISRGFSIPFGGSIIMVGQKK
jgi:SAM-dependent methyltransferase